VLCIIVPCVDSHPALLCCWGDCSQSVGHSYNLMDLHSKRLLNVEVGPGGASSVVEVEPGGFYFHANMYKHLVVRQRTDEQQLPPRGPSTAAAGGGGLL